MRFSFGTKRGTFRRTAQAIAQTVARALTFVPPAKGALPGDAQSQGRSTTLRLLMRPSASTE